MTVINVFKTFFKNIVDIICPEVCLACGKRFQTDSTKLICHKCLNDLTRVDHFRNDSNVITDLFDSELIRIEYGSCYLQFMKGEPTQQLIHNMKYYGHEELGVRLGRMAAQTMKRYGRFNNIDYMLPVPMHPDKLKIRGFNQAERIAEGMKQIFDVPIREDILSKTMNTTSQTKMNKKERAENSSKIFAAKPANDALNAHFLIIDDVMTTGSTLVVCAKKLKEAMPDCKISIFALAKA